MVNVPGTHVANQGRELKPNTGRSRPGNPYRETIPSSGRGQTILPQLGTVEEVGGRAPEQTILPELPEEKEFKAIRMMGGEMRWLKLDETKEMAKILLEERRL